MTHAEWLAAIDPTPMLEFLHGRASARKLRLFGCAAVRAVWPDSGEAVSGAADAAERYADGTLSKAALRRARHAVRDKRYGLDAASPETSPSWAACWLAETITTLNAYNSVVAELKRLGQGTPPLVVPDWPVTCDRLRDIFGDPFRHVVVKPEWLTAAVVALAAGIYADQAFDRLPILADALQDTGCSDDDILNHCRAGGVHVRGCWVVDEVLGKD